MDKSSVKAILLEFIDSHEVESLDIVSLPEEGEPSEGWKTFKQSKHISINMILIKSEENINAR
jgi:hypothetical protein